MISLEASETKIITLITDFGYKDPFVGQMKGVILSINPDVRIVDITHNITSHDIEEAAFVLFESFQYFPEGSIHMVIVDPGVGSKRRALIVSADGHYFIAPDNGLLSYIIKDRAFKAFCLENERYILKKESPTFQGRDVFAPASAWLSKGVPVHDFGNEVIDPIVLDTLTTRLDKSRIIGKIVYIDKFGNAITNIKVKAEKIKKVKVKQLILPVVSCYAHSENNPAALINSNGFIEIFIYKNNAAQLLNLKRDDTVEVLLNG